MSATRRPLARRGDYTDQEKRVLLTGIPLHATSTRFGHPKSGWDREEIRIAWGSLRDELLPRWESADFDYFRQQDPRPFAERFLSQANDHYPFSTGPRSDD